MSSSNLINEDELCDNELCGIFGVDPLIPDYFFTSRGKVRLEYCHQYKLLIASLQNRANISKKRKSDCLN